MKKRLLIRGPINSASGYGLHTRFVIDSLSMFPHDFELFVIPTNWGHTNWILPTDKNRPYYDGLIQKTAQYIQNGGQFDASLQVTIPNEWEKLCPVNIGVTAGIETTKVAPQWLEKALLVDRIITVSHHSKSVYENTSYEAKTQDGRTVTVKCQTPIDVVHYPVREFEPAKLELDFDYDFNFLSVFQWSPRKNAEQTVKWFIEENIDKEVGLIVKTNLAKNCTLDQRHTMGRLKALLQKYENRKCKVYLLHGYMSDEEMTALYRHPKVKCLINIAGGEGFGLPIFEAAYNELPVMTVAWSGQMDYMFMPAEDKKKKVKMRPMFAKVDCSLQPIQKDAVWNGVLQADSMWAYPDQGSFKMRMREMMTDYGRFKSQAKKLSDHIRSNFTLDQKRLDLWEAVLRVWEPAAAASANNVILL